jgi:GT2 family glycosyltransferase
VIIPTCGRPDLLARCLERLAPGAQTLSADRYEVIVSDDGVPTVEGFLAEKYPWARWCPGPRRGPAANRNAGAREARGEWLAFTDDDCLPDPGWLAGFVAATHPGCQVYEGKTTCEGGVPSPLYHAPVNLSGGYLWSCNMLIRRSTFEELGGFDEEFRYPAMEDVDLRERLVREGHHFEFVPEAMVDHPARRLASGRRLARYHESAVYHWYKAGHRRVVAFTVIYRIIYARMSAIRRHRLGGDTLRAVASLLLELGETVLRLPLWEWRYRRRFRPQAGPARPRGVTRAGAATEPHG